MENSKITGERLISCGLTKIDHEEINTPSSWFNPELTEDGLLRATPHIVISSNAGFHKSPDGLKGSIRENPIKTNDLGVPLF